MNENTSKLRELVTELSVDAGRYPVSRPTDPRQSVPTQELFPLYLMLFSHVFAEIEDRLGRLEYKAGVRE